MNLFTGTFGAIICLGCLFQSTSLAQTATLSFSKAGTKAWLKLHMQDSSLLHTVIALNRTDRQHIARLDSIIVPNEACDALKDCLPFPQQMPLLLAVNKVIYFSYPLQIFAAYEKGILVYTGPTNMGRKKDPSPIGLFFTNWKAVKGKSSFNEKWDLRWNFNFQNKEGVGWHEYALSGLPTSHACLRLQEEDAQYLYHWAEQCILQDAKVILIKGTPVIIFGKYLYKAPKPWLQLLKDPKANNITEGMLTEETNAYLAEILAEQQKRADYFLKKQ